jgi:hypothetical protein
MRKHILPRLKALLTAACATLYTRQTRPATPKFSLEPEPDHLREENDCWLFESDTGHETVRAKLSKDMDAIADNLYGLRETLALIHGETPFPVEATTLAPCAITHHDEMLFDGEPLAPTMPAQEEISGGEQVFLFDDAPTFEDELTDQAQQHAA